ncbi:MAG: hypothetical protein EX260_11720 [Desulfobulbaceae bacterium]|nr:MAG: hypothetical protein EX260_11720 [Desulfobulbaceae bacterium]
MASTLPNLNLNPDTEAEIEQALNAGLEVITHTDPVSVPGYSGAGYIIYDPVTGDGAYKIGGGQNGFWERFQDGGYDTLLSFSLFTLGALLTKANLPVLLVQIATLVVVYGTILAAANTYLQILDATAESGNIKCYEIAPAAIQWASVIAVIASATFPAISGMVVAVANESLSYLISQYVVDACNIF